MKVNEITKRGLLRQDRNNAMKFCRDGYGMSLLELFPLFEDRWKGDGLSESM